MITKVDSQGLSSWPGDKRVDPRLDKEPWRCGGPWLAPGAEEALLRPSGAL